MRITRGGAAQAVLVLVGLFLMAAPALLGCAGVDDAADNHRAVGPVVVAIAFLAIFPITRLVRWGNAGPGLWLLGSPLLVDGPRAATVVSLLCGAAVLALFWIEKADQSDYGGGWDTLVKDDRLPTR
jgi:hypothetical protein